MVGFYNYTVILTYMSLIFSVVGMTFALDGRITAALVCMLSSGLCDSFDGKVARTRKRTEEEKRFGIQIDSLCDLVCFCVFPAILGYCIGMRSPLQVAVMAAYVLAGVIRLAYFNVTEEIRQDATDKVRDCYLGLPVTMAAMLVPLSFLAQKYMAASAFAWFYTAYLALLAFFFIAPVRVPKPHGKGVYVMLAGGLATCACLFLFR